MSRDRRATENANDPAHDGGAYPVLLWLCPGDLVRRLNERAPIKIRVRMSQLSLINAEPNNTRQRLHSAAFFLPAPLSARKRDARFSLTTWRSRAIARPSAGTSWVITEPVAT